MLHGLLDDARAPAHVLVRAVGARADQADLDVDGPAVLLGVVAEFADGRREIGREGTVDVGLERVEVDFDYLRGATFFFNKKKV